MQGLKTSSFDLFLFFHLAMQLSSNLIFKKALSSNSENFLSRENFLVVVFFLIFIIKIRIEGSRMNLIPALICETLLIVNRLLFNEGVILKVASGIFLIFYIITIFLLKSYYCPNPTGPYKVGYKQLEIIQGYKYAVFYPTEKLTGRDVFWITDSQYMDTMYDNSKDPSSKFHLPKSLVLFCLNFMRKIKLNVHQDAEIIENDGKRRFIVFSHGLGGNRNNYSQFTIDLASQGYIIFASEHEEKIALGYKFNKGEEQKFLEIVSKYRCPQLEKRVENIQQLLDYLSKPKNMEALFQTAINLDWDNLVLAGHSFGAATALMTGFVDKRVKGLVLLDPWLYPLNSKFLTQDVGIPILAVNTETFPEAVKIYSNKEKVDSIFEKITLAKDKILNCVVKNTDHLHQSDMIWVMHGELKLFKMIRSKADVYKQIHLNRMLIRRFIDNVIFEKKPAQKALDEVYEDMKRIELPSKELGILHGCGA